MAMQLEENDHDVTDGVVLTTRSGLGLQTSEWLQKLLIKSDSQDKCSPRGGTSVLFTRTMPLRTAARRMRFRAKETH